jgi:hypothetical protein
MAVFLADFWRTFGGLLGGLLADFLADFWRTSFGLNKGNPSPNTRCVRDFSKCTPRAREASTAGRALGADLGADLRLLAVALTATLITATMSEL